MSNITEGIFSDSYVGEFNFYTVLGMTTALS